MLLLLLAADWALPAPRPSWLMDSHSALPPIRVHSDLKGPDPVFIDTNVISANRAPAENESAAAPSQIPRPEVAAAAANVSSTGGSSTDTHLRESLAQLQSAAPDRAVPARKPRKITARQRKHVTGTDRNQAGICAWLAARNILEWFA
ncbi:hypothetical protein OWC48_45035 [Bradyrhizobium sp. Arg816]|nr:hypothetical protein [Bradyrhizobium sp. Arg816]